MNPQKEYFIRNNLNNTYIEFIGGRAIVANKNKTKISEKYRLVEINRMNREGNDGIYVGRFDFSVAVPQKVGAFFYKLDDDIIYWHEYFDFIKEKIRELSGQGWYGIKDADELKVAVWEMFSFIHDSYLSQLPVDLIMSNHKIFNNDTKLEDKCKLIDKFINFINSGNINSNNYFLYNKLIDGWNHFDELFFSNKYCYWFSELIKR